MSIPLNRIVAFAGPYIAVASGAVATWLIAKLNALGVAGLEQSDLAQQVAAGLTFTLTAALTWLGHSKWLAGHHLQLAGDAAVQAAALAAPVPPMLDVAGIDPDMDELMAAEEDLPSDDEEFAEPADEEARLTPDEPEASD